MLEESLEKSRGELIRCTTAHNISVHARTRLSPEMAASFSNMNVGYCQADILRAC